MDLREAKALFDYTRWANDRMLTDAGALDAAALSRDSASSFPSMLSTITHMFQAEWAWMRRWRGESPRTRPVPGDTLDAIRSAWRDVQADQSSFLTELSEERLEASIAYQDLAGNPKEFKLADTFRHIANHSTYHRGQVVTMLRQSGQKPQATDYVVYVEAIR